MDVKDCIILRKKEKDCKVEAITSAWDAPAPFKPEAGLLNH